MKIKSKKRMPTTGHFIEIHYYDGIPFANSCRWEDGRLEELDDDEWIRYLPRVSKCTKIRFITDW